MRAVIRTLSFFEQWMAEVIRQPALMFTLVIAPFLILFAFGEGVDIGGPRPRTLIVQERGAQQPIEPLLQDMHQEVRIVGVTESLPLARRSLEKGDVDAVAIVPPDGNAYTERGEQIPIRVLLGEIDPVRRSYAHSYLRDQIAVLNQRAVAEALDNARGGVTGVFGLESAPGGPANIDSHVLSAPFVLEMEDVTPITPGFTAFYSPGVLALLVHHLAITLAALTLARMRLVKVIEVLRVAPVRTTEIILGNYLSYAVLCGMAAAGLLAMLVLGLDVPVVGSLALVALIIGLLIFSSLGVGFLASQLSSSVQQAAQIAMLILLASVFFGGFAFSLDRISWPFRAVSHVLPATYGIRSLQDVMLRGFEPRVLDLSVLVASGAVLLVLNVLLLRRITRPS